MLHTELIAPIPELLRRHADRPFLVALSNQLKVDEAELDSLPENVLRFRNMPLPDEVARAALALTGPLAG